MTTRQTTDGRTRLPVDPASRTDAPDDMSGRIVRRAHSISDMEYRSHLWIMDVVDGYGRTIHVSGCGLRLYPDAWRTVSGVTTGPSCTTCHGRWSRMRRRLSSWIDDNGRR